MTEHHDPHIAFVEDRSTSGRITVVFIDDMPVWRWTWHIDGPPSEDALSLLRALGWRDEA